MRLTPDDISKIKQLKPSLIFLLAVVLFTFFITIYKANIEGIIGFGTSALSAVIASSMCFSSMVHLNIKNSSRERARRYIDLIYVSIGAIGLSIGLDPFSAEWSLQTQTLAKIAVLFAAGARIAKSISELWLESWQGTLQKQWGVNEDDET